MSRNRNCRGRSPYRCPECDALLGSHVRHFSRARTAKDTPHLELAGQPLVDKEISDASELSRRRTS